MSESIRWGTRFRSMNDAMENKENWKESFNVCLLTNTVHFSVFSGRCVQGHPRIDCYVIPIKLVIWGDNINSLEWRFFNIIPKQQKEGVRMLSWLVGYSLYLWMWAGPPGHSLAPNVVLLPHAIENAFLEKESETFPYLCGLLISTSDSGRIASLDMDMSPHHSCKHGQGNARPLSFPFPF